MLKFKKLNEVAKNNNNKIFILFIIRQMLTSPELTRPRGEIGIALMPREVTK